MLLMEYRMCQQWWNAPDRELLLSILMSLQHCWNHGMLNRHKLFSMQCNAIISPSQRYLLCSRYTEQLIHMRTLRCELHSTQLVNSQHWICEIVPNVVLHIASWTGFPSWIPFSRQIKQTSEVTVNMSSPAQPHQIEFGDLPQHSPTCFKTLSVTLTRALTALKSTLQTLPNALHKSCLALPPVLGKTTITLADQIKSIFSIAKRPNSVQNDHHLWKQTTLTQSPWPTICHKNIATSASPHLSHNTARSLSLNNVTISLTNNLQQKHYKQCKQHRT